MIQAPETPVTLIFDGDSSLWGSPSNDKCSLCGSHSPSYVRIRKKGGEGEPSGLLGHVCPTCVARMTYQLERLSWWHLVSSSALAAFKRLTTERTRLANNSAQTHGYFKVITKK